MSIQPWMRLTIGGALVVSSVAASAGVLFTQNVTAFNNYASSQNFLGVEDFEGSVLPNGEIAQAGPVLAPGIPSGPFTSGLNPAPGITVQSNFLSGSLAIDFGILWRSTE